MGPPPASGPRPTASFGPPAHRLLQALGLTPASAAAQAPKVVSEGCCGAGARLFGGSGGVLPRTLYATTFGTALDGSAVTSAATYTAAVAQLRLPAGHSPTSTTWANPVNWAAYNQGLSAMTMSSAVGNSVEGTVAALQQAGIEPLLVQWNTCSAFSYSTFDAASAAYWAERWELYKHQYALARWAWTKSVRKLEFWNEPDLNAICINLNATQWTDYYLVPPQPHR